MGLLEIALLLKGHAPVAVRLCIGRVEAYGPGVIRDRLGPPALPVKWGIGVCIK